MLGVLVFCFECSPVLAAYMESCGWHLWRLRLIYYYDCSAGWLASRNIISKEPYKCPSGADIKSSFCVVSPRVADPRVAISHSLISRADP